MSSLKDLAITFRAAQLYAHAAHNQLTGCSFFADHAFAGEVYGAMEDAYDSVVERAIGTGESLELLKMNCQAADMVLDCSLKDSEHIFGQLLENEISILKAIEKASKGASYGTDNLLAQLADDSEVRTYKIKQRTIGA